MFNIKDPVIREYIEWLGFENPVGYHGIEKSLMQKKYEPIHKLDRDRLQDGMNLRMKYNKEQKISNKPEIWILYDVSELEMLSALARKMETSILRDSELGDRSTEWFQMMMANIRIWGHPFVVKQPNKVDLWMHMQSYIDKNDIK